MIWKITTWLSKTGDPNYLCFPVSGFCEGTDILEWSAVENTLQAHQQMVLQFHRATYEVRFTVGFPYSAGQPFGNAGSAWSTGHNRDWGRRFNYSGTAEMGKDWALRIDRFGSFGKAHQWYGRDLLTVDDLVPFGAERHKTKLDTVSSIMLDNVAHRIEQARIEWNYRGLNPHKVSRDSGDMIFAPVVAYRCAGATHFKSQRDIENRKNTTGIAHRNAAHLATAYTCSSALAAWDAFQTFGNPIPWWRRHGYTMQVAAGFQAARDTCRMFHEPQAAGVWPSAWKPHSLDPVWTSAAAAALALLNDLKLLYQTAQQLENQWSPEPNYGHYGTEYAKWNRVLEKHNIILNCRFNGYANISQQQGVTCPDPAQQ